MRSREQLTSPCPTRGRAPRGRPQRARGRRQFVVLGVLLVVATSGTGCLWAPEMGRLRRDIEAQVPGARFRSEVKLTLGPWSLGLARLLTSVVPPAVLPPAHEANGYLQGLGRVQMAVYRTRSLPPLDGLRLPAQLRQMIAEAGWRVVVKVRDARQAVWVLEQDEGDGIRDLYIVALDSKRLVLLRVEGLVDRLFTQAMQGRAPEVPGIMGIQVE